LKGIGKGRESVFTEGAKYVLGSGGYGASGKDEKVKERILKAMRF